MIHFSRAHRSSPSTATLSTLIQEKGLRRYGVFFTTGEGATMPNGEEESTGFVIDDAGRVFFYAIGWDQEHQAPTLTEWVNVPLEPHWRDAPEYLKARQAAGLNP